MEKALIKVYDTEGLSPDEWKERFSGVNERLEPFEKECEFDVEMQDVDNIPFGDIKIKKSEKTGEMTTFIFPDLEWLRETFYKNAQEYDECVVHFAYDELEDIVLGADNDLGGWSAGEEYGVSEVIIRSHDAEKWIERFLHETGHSTADHFMNGAPDQTHYYDYKLDNLDAWISMWDWSQLEGTKELEPKKKIDIIKKHIDVDWSADNRWNEENYFKGENDKDSIVLHTLLGTIMGSYSWLDATNLSYHYLIDTDGTIYEQNSPENGAWHAGRVHNPNDRAKSFYGKYGRLGTDSANPNRHSIGIAFARDGEHEITEEQVRSCIELIDYLGQKYDRQYTENNIFAHCEITDYKPEEVENYRKQVLEAGQDHTGADKKGINISPVIMKEASRLVEPLKWLKGASHLLFPSK